LRLGFCATLGFGLRVPAQRILTTISTQSLTVFALHITLSESHVFCRALTAALNKAARRPKFRSKSDS
jgi:hypothetical protein